MKTLKELRARLLEINKACATAQGDALTKLFDEAVDIQGQIDDAISRKSIDTIAKIAGMEPTNTEQIDLASEKAMRGNMLKTNKSVTYGASRVSKAMSTANIALATHTAKEINPTFNPVSSILDMIKPVVLLGGEGYKRTFTKSYGIGDYTEENAPATTAEPQTGVAPVTKSKMTAYSEEPEEMLKLSDNDFDGFVGNSVEKATRCKIAKEIMVGNGATNRLRGIFYNPTEDDEQVIDPTTDIEFSIIDENTLDELTYSYGGDEDVEGNAVLILNKNDLKAFSKIRDKQGKKVYAIDKTNKTIDTTPYVINSACKALSNPATAVGAYCMAYGNMKNYELAIFSDLEVSRSTEYKFKEGQICFKSCAFMGGNVTAYNGFIRAKKKATV